MRKELQDIYNYLYEKNPLFRDIVNETEGMSSREIAIKYNIDTTIFEEQAG